MLPAAHRLTDAASFRETTRRGRRASSRSVVTYVVSGSTTDVFARPARAGLVVSRSVGNSVVRNRVKRQLRHLLAVRVAEWPIGSTIVVRALPGAAEASSGTLDRDLTRCLSRSFG